MKNLYYFFSVLFIFVACSTNDTTDSIGAEHEVFLDSLHNQGIVPLSSYFKTAKIIALETNEDNLIRVVDAVQVTDDYIFILDRSYKRLYCFNKKGEFIRRIGNVGTGPEDFNSISDFAIDDENIIYILDRHGYKINTYTITGEYINSINLKNIRGNVGHIQAVEDYLYLDFQDDRNKIKNNNPLLIKLDKESGNIIDKHLPADRYNLGFNLVTLKDGSFFYSKNSVSPHYSPIYSNVVYSLNEEVKPYFEIKSNHLIKKEDIQELDLSNPNVITEINRINKIKSIVNFIEIGNYIICEYSAGLGLDLLFYCKKSKNAWLYDMLYDDYIYKNVNESVPHYFACSDKEGVYAYIAVDDVPFFTNQFHADNLNFDFKQQHENYLQGLSEDSNPLLFYYELK